MAERYGLMVPGAKSGSPAIDVLSPYNRRKNQRYPADHLTGTGGRPQVRFVREKVAR